MKRFFPKLLFVATFLFCLSTCTPKRIVQIGDEKAQMDTPVRGIWLTNAISDALDTPENIKSAVKLCHQNGINTIFMVVWNRGRTLYPSAVMKKHFNIPIDEKYIGRDPLQEVIAAAKPFGIRVFAWFEFGFSCDLEEKTGIVEGKEILATKPQWAAINAKGEIVKKNGFRWLNAFNPEVQDFILSLVVETVANYPDLAGIQGDDRLPALPSEGGYDAATKVAYQLSTGRAVPLAAKDSAWLDWRSARLNIFAKRLYDAVKKTNPRSIVSMSPSLFPWSKEEYLQDWVTWLRDGYVDMVCPQVYRYEIDRYEKEIVKLKQQIPSDKWNRVFPGILLRVNDYYATPQYLDRAIACNRENGLKGEVFFYFEGMKRHVDWFKKYTKQNN